MKIQDTREEFTMRILVNKEVNNFKNVNCACRKLEPKCDGSATLNIHLNN